MAMDEYTAIKWLRSRMVQDAAFLALAPGGVWEMKAGHGSEAGIYVVLTQIAPPNYYRSLNGAGYYGMDVLIQLSVWMHGTDLAALLPVVNRMDALCITDQVAVVTGAGAGVVWACEKSGSMTPPDEPRASGDTYRQALVEYRVYGYQP